MTLRSGPRAHKFGDPWDGVCQAKVEHDRFVYLYGGRFGGQSEYLDNDVASSSGEMREMIAAVRDEAERFGWKGVRWKRLKDGEERTFTRKFKFREAA